MSLMAVRHRSRSEHEVAWTYSCKVHGHVEVYSALAFTCQRAKHPRPTAPEIYIEAKEIGRIFWVRMHS